MNMIHRIGGATLLASLLGLSGCPSDRDHRGEERRDSPSAEQKRHDDSRDERREPARNDSPEQRRDPADNRPR